MTPDPTDARIARLRATRDRLEAQLNDPKTPPYSIAPLSNQLRLTDNQLDKIQRAENAKDDGLPKAEELNILDLFQFRVRLADVPRVPATRRDHVNEWTRKQEAIFQSWRDAGFVPLPMPERVAGEDRRAVLEAWADENRALLLRCLEQHNQEESPQ